MCNGNAVVVLCTLQIWLITLSDRTGISLYLFWITHQLLHFPKEIGVLDTMVLPLRWKRLHDDIPDTSLEPYWENVSVSDERGWGNFDGASCSQGANMTDFRAETYSTNKIVGFLWIFLIGRYVSWCRGWWCCDSKWFKRGIFVSIKCSYLTSNDV